MHLIRISNFIAAICLLAFFSQTHICKAGLPDPPKLASLTLESGSGLVGFTALTLSPAFDPITNPLTYSATIPFEHDDVNIVTATAENPFHVVEVNPPTSFPAGATTPLLVTVADDPFVPFQTTTYTINVFRETSNTNAALSNLVVSGTPISPAVAPLTFTYNGTVGFSTTSVTVTPTALQSGSTITVEGISVDDGTPSPPIPLNLGQKQIVIRVTSQDGSVTKGYEVLINRLEQDGDGDGMEDSWEFENGLNLTVDDSLLDKDADGLLNLFEYAFGSDPCESSDAAFPTVEVGSNGFATITFHKAITDGTTLYTPEISVPGQAWTSDFTDETLPGSPQTQVWKDNNGGSPTAPPARWLRVKVTPNF